MKSEKNAAQRKRAVKSVKPAVTDFWFPKPNPRTQEELIKLVKAIKPAAIAAGFDFPTEEPETATPYQLREFIIDVTSFIQTYANGEV